MFGRVAICGLGVLGGSLAKALRRAFPETVIAGCDLDRNFVRSALEDRVIDSAFSADELPQCDLAAVALPVYGSIPVLSSMLERTSTGTLVIDMGSVKAPIVDALRGRPGFERFVPCHPMAGSEQSGYGHSREDLFSGASVIVTPHEKNDGSDVSRVSRLWERLGASVISSDAAFHDAMVARMSHLPHLLSSALAIEAASAGKGAVDFSGKGLADMTRLAGGSPSMWAEISGMNAEHILRAIGEYKGLLDELERSLKDAGGQRVRGFLDKGAEAKRELYGEENSRRG